MIKVILNEIHKKMSLLATPFSMGWYILFLVYKITAPVAYFET